MNKTKAQVQEVDHLTFPLHIFSIQQAPSKNERINTSIDVSENTMDYILLKKFKLCYCFLVKQ